MFVDSICILYDYKYRGLSPTIINFKRGKLNKYKLTFRFDIVHFEVLFEVFCCLFVNHSVHIKVLYWNTFYCNINLQLKIYLIDNTNMSFNISSALIIKTYDN